MLHLSDFHPPWYLKNAHLQTLAASIFRRTPRVNYQRQRLTLPDDDFVDLDWIRPVADQPLLLLLHGLEGNSRSNYAAGLALQAEALGINFAVLHARNCSGEPNRLPRAYHAGETRDLAWVVTQLQPRFPAMAAVGFSLGGNALLKWLGETGGDNPLCAAAAVSVPFLLMDGSERFKHGFSHLYEKHLLNNLKRSQRLKIRNGTLAITEAELDNIKTLYEFDDRLTAPLHGFGNAANYYRINSSRPFLSQIRVPTLILHARDDPFMFPSSMPGDTELSETVTLEWSEHGGHVGFVSAERERRYWLEWRLREWAAQALCPR